MPDELIPDPYREHVRRWAADRAPADRGGMPGQDDAVGQDTHPGEASEDLIPPAGEPFPGRDGYVTGTCGHAVAGSEWRAGFRQCERCGPPYDPPADGGFAYVVQASPDSTAWPYDDEGGPRVGTRDWHGQTAELAQVLLDEYQADLASGQITLPGPVAALRVMIWPGESPGPVSEATAWVRRLPPSEADELAVLDATRGLAHLAARHLGEAYDPVMTGAEGYACAFPLEVEGRFLRVTVQLASEDELAAITGEPEVCPIDGTPIDLESGLCLMNCQHADREQWRADGNPPYDEAAEQGRNCPGCGSHDPAVRYGDGGCADPWHDAAEDAAEGARRQAEQEADMEADMLADQDAELEQRLAEAGTLYTYRTESTMTGRGWADADADRLGTVRYAGTPEEFAAAMLAGYLGDVARDAGLNVGDPGAEPACPVRVIVWTSDQPAGLGPPAAVLYHPADSAPEPQAGRVTRTDSYCTDEGVASGTVVSHPGDDPELDKLAAKRADDWGVSQAEARARLLGPGGAR